jgi:archaellum component FlaC
MKLDRSTHTGAAIGDKHLENLFQKNFGMSSEQFERELEIEFEQASPEERAEFGQLADLVNEAFPGMNESLERISNGLTDMNKSMSEMRKSMSSMSERVGRIEDNLGMKQ